MKRSLRVSILVDNERSWFYKYLDKALGATRRYDPGSFFISTSRELKEGDILFILSCDRILSKEDLSKHKNNIVIHASDLPKGRGWAPWTWHVEAGKNIVPITLFEAGEGCDDGDYYIKDSVRLNGTELVDDIREKLADKIIKMMESFLSSYPMKAVPQKGKAIYYRRRRPDDNELDIDRSIRSQFNKLRVADNERYPAHFRLKGKRYILKVFKDKDEKDSNS